MTAIESAPQLSGYTVEWAAPRDFILSRRNRLYRTSTLAPPFIPCATIAAPLWRSLGARLRPVQRLLRFDVSNVIERADSSLFVTFDKQAGVVRGGEYRALSGLRRPCRVLRGGAAVAPDGSIYFGEYVTRVRGRFVYRLSPGARALETVYDFGSQIRHVHGIYFDEYSGALLCLTGDTGQECRILRTLDGFQTLEVIGEGDETWRAVSALFTPGFIYYGTDAERRQNHIYRIARASGERACVGEVSGTVFYSKQANGHLFFGTTAEAAPSQRENVAALYCLSPDGELQEVTKFAKDRWPGKSFGFGKIHFPYVNRLDGELYFQVIGCRDDGQTFRALID